MGRHSLEDDRVFLRSLVFFVLKWVGVFALPALAVWGIWRLVTQPEDGGTVVAGVATTPSPKETPEAGPIVSSPAPTPSPEESPTRAEATSLPQRSGRLQVLNGSAPGKGQKAADRLRAAGYEIVVVQNASRRYERTTVFFQEGSRQLAQEVAAFLPAEVVDPAPSNLSRSIPVTVVIGDDYRA